MGKKQGGRPNERPAKNLQVTVPSQWNKPTSGATLLELPSGNVVRCLRPGMSEFVELGMVPNALVSTVDLALKEHIPPSMDEIISDQGKLEATQKFMDDVTLHCIVEPEVLPVPLQDVEREEDVLYLDMIDPEDQVFIFQYAVGGTRSVQRFRQLQVADMATVAAEHLVAGAAERSS